MHPFPLARKRFKIFLIHTLMLISVRVGAQTSVPPADTANFPYWITMMQDPNVKFKSTQSAFYKYWAGRDTEAKGNGYKVFKRWEYINESRVLPNGKLQSPDYVSNVFNQYNAIAASQKQTSTTCNWTIMGPTAYPTNSTAQPTGMGRLNAIAFHPTDANIIFVGSPSGGIWKTTDGGANWVSLSSNMPTLGVSSILIHPSNPDIIFIGSGDRDSGDAPGLGIFKSTDGGATWGQINTVSNTPGSLDLATVGAMVMHPTDPNIMLAATSNGLFRTIDGGATWSRRVNANWKDVKFKPGDPTVAYAAVGGALWRSTNTGLNWAAVTLPITGSRIVIGVTPADPTYVYLVQSNAVNQTFSGLMRSTDSGATFSIQSTTPNIYDYACDGSGTGSQAFYDLCINVDPNNKDIVYVGSINNWKSTNGGVSWSIVSHWVGSSYADPCGGTASVHADQHALEWSPLNGKLYVGNDGGIYWTNDGGTNWTEISGGLEIAQVYKIGQSTTTQGLSLNGYQDNGSAVNTNTSFTTVRGGDGMECLIDYSDVNYRYTTGPNGTISRSSGGAYSNIGKNGTNGITESGAWVTPFKQHITDPNIMFAGYKNVWRTNNVKASPASSVSWSAISTGETENCIAIEPSAADANVVYVSRSGQMKRSDNANASPASVTWTACALPGGYTPTDIESHPTDPNIVYAAANYGVYRSADKGASWTDISGSLPALFTNCLVYNKNSDEGLYVGNQTSIWYKDNNMADWTLCSDGLPVVDVREIEIYYDAALPSNSRLKAATYGRGLWQAELPFACILPTGITFTQTIASCLGMSPNNNGTISLAAVTNGTHYGVSTLNAASYDGPAFALATAIPGTLPAVVKTGVPNSGGAYIVRIYNGANDCYTDQTVTVAPVVCNCPTIPCGTTTAVKN